VHNDESKESYALSLLRAGKYRSAETLLEELILHSTSQTIQDRSLYHASLAAYEQGKLVEALDYLHMIKEPTPQSKKNAALIATEIERRRTEKPPQRSSQKSPEPNPNRGNDSQESGDREKRTSESNGQQKGEEENEQNEQNKSGDPKEQAESSSSENQKQDRSEENALEEPAESKEEGAEEREEENESGDPEGQQLAAGNQEIPEDMYTQMQEQSAVRLINSVKEGKNRGFANSEDGDSGSKAW